MLTVFDSIKKPQGYTININGIDRLAAAITEHIWTPNFFKDNYRKKVNFIKTPLIVLDCDEGMTIEEAKINFAEYKHIIGTTRSHGKEKNGKVLDRFRVVLFLEKYCADRAIYEYNMKLLCEAFNMDSACAEASRCFYPCVEIVSINRHGSYWELQPVPKYVKPYYSKPRKGGPVSSTIKTINQVLDGTRLVSDKGRHMNLLWCACRLGDMGWTEQETINHMSGTYLFNTLEKEDGHGEIRRQIGNGIKGIIG